MITAVTFVIRLIVIIIRFRTITIIPANHIIFICTSNVLTFEAWQPVISFQVLFAMNILSILLIPKNASYNSSLWLCPCSFCLSLSTTLAVHSLNYDDHGNLLIHHGLCWSSGTDHCIFLDVDNRYDGYIMQPANARTPYVWMYWPGSSREENKKKKYLVSFCSAQPFHCPLLVFLAMKKLMLQFVSWLAGK